MSDLVTKSKRILAAVDNYCAFNSANTRLELRKVIMAELESAGVLAIRELENIVNAKRFDREVFDDDTGFADWAQNRARYTLAQCDVSAVIQNTAVDERMAAQNSESVDGYVQEGGGGALPRAVRLDEAALQQWLVDVSQNKANTPAQQNAAWLLLQTVARGVKGTPAPCPGLDDRAAEWDAWHEEFKRSHGYGPGISDAWDAAYRAAWKRATAGVAVPQNGQEKNHG